MKGSQLLQLGLQFPQGGRLATAGLHQCGKILEQTGLGLGNIPEGLTERLDGPGETVQLRPQGITVELLQLAGAGDYRPEGFPEELLAVDHLGHQGGDIETQGPAKVIHGAGLPHVVVFQFSKIACVLCLPCGDCIRVLIGGAGFPPVVIGQGLGDDPDVELLEETEIEIKVGGNVPLGIVRAY